MQQLAKHVALVSGSVKAGDTVVTDGLYGLTPGARVAVQQPAQAATPLRSSQAGRLGISP